MWSLFRFLVIDRSVFFFLFRYFSVFFSADCHTAYMVIVINVMVCSEHYK